MTAAVGPPVIVVVLLCVLRHSRVLYTSDSTAQQSIVRTWLDVGHGTTHLPPDTWAFKFPLYLVLENLPLAPLDKLLAAIIVLNVLTFVFAGIAVTLLAPQARWYELAVPMTWLAALGGGIGSNRMLTNYRNVELGLSLLLLALVAVRLREPARPFRWWPAALAALLLAVFWFDDPYFMVLVGVPLAVLAVLWFFFTQRGERGDRDRRLLWLAAVLAVSVVLLPVLQRLARLGGISIDHISQLSPSILSGWHRDLGPLAENAALQLGVNRWHDLPGWQVVTQILIVAGQVAMVAASTALAVHGWRARAIIPFFLGLHWPLVVAGVLTQENHPSRYLILIVYDLAAASGMALPLLRKHFPRTATGLVALLAVGAIANLVAVSVSSVDTARRPSDALPLQQALVRAVQDTGAQKGFAPFWSANITSYLAGDGYTAYEIVCARGVLTTRTWLSDTARLTRPASTTFLIWVPAGYAAGGCTAQVRDAQFGPPAQVRTLENGTQVLTYAYDIATRLELAPNQRTVRPPVAAPSRG